MLPWGVIESPVGPIKMSCGSMFMPARMKTTSNWMYRLECSIQAPKQDLELTRKPSMHNGTHPEAGY